MKKSKIEHFNNGWHKQINPQSKNICIWSDKWLENLKQQQQKENGNTKPTTKQT